jgi:hypothetical protein
MGRVILSHIEEMKNSWTVLLARTEAAISETKAYIIKMGRK